jgi:hypothetical protein
MMGNKCTAVLDEATGIIYAYRILLMGAEEEPTHPFVVVVAEDPRIGSDIGGHKVIQLPRNWVETYGDNELREEVLKKVPSLRWAVEQPYLYVALARGMNRLPTD